MTDLGVSHAPALARAPLGWPVVAIANLVGGVAAIYPTMLATWWLVDVLGGSPGYTSDPGFAAALGQVSLVMLVLGFVGGNLWLQWALVGRRPTWWVLGLVCAAAPSAASVAHHALFYGPS